MQEQEEKNARIIDLSGVLKNYKKTTFQNDDSGSYYLAPKSRLACWMIRFSGGFIKNENQANVFLLVFIVVMVAMSLFLVINGNNQSAYPLPADFNT